MARILAGAATGTWWERHVPSTGRPSTFSGPVQPFGVRSTIIGQRGRRLATLARRVLDAGDLVERLVERARERLVHDRGIVAGDDERPPP